MLRRLDHVGHDDESCDNVTRKCKDITYPVSKEGLQTESVPVRAGSEQPATQSVQPRQEAGQKHAQLPGTVGAFRLVVRDRATAPYTMAWETSA